LQDRACFWLDSKRHGLVGRHGAQDVDQLPRAHGGGEVACIAAQLGGGADLDFQVAGGQLQMRCRSCASARWPESAACDDAPQCLQPTAEPTATLSCVAFRTIMSSSEIFSGKLRSVVGATCRKSFSLYRL
jgi:hypothetical protein